MKTVNTAYPIISPCEYLLVLTPHDTLQQKILHVKTSFSKSFSANVYLDKPKLVITRFLQSETAEDRIVNRLKTVAMAQAAFKIELKDFGSYPSHSIFINVTSKLPLKQLIRSIKTVQPYMKIDKDNKPYFNEEPNFLIAQKLLPWQYEKGWAEYSHRKFTGRFIADKMLLLKRRHGDKRYQVAQYFKFENLPVLTKQGELFF